MQLSAAALDAGLYSVASVIGPAAVLKVLSGPAPVSCAAAETGTLLARVVLPESWLDSALAQVGVWQETSADGTGVAGHFRIYDAAESVCGLQGDVSSPVSSLEAADLWMDSLDFVAGQDFTITRFQILSETACRARGQSLYRRLVRELCRQAGGTHGLRLFQSLLRDLKSADSMTVNSAGDLMLEGGAGALTTEAGVPLQLEAGS